MKKIITSFLIAHIFTIQGDTVYLHNESPLSLYAAPYYTYTNHAVRTAIPQVLPAHETISFKRPGFKFDSSSRELAISLTESPLKQDISIDILELLTRQNIANPAFDNFYVSFVEGKIASFNRINWQIIQPIVKKTKKVTTSFLAAITGKLRKLWQKPPYDTKQASVRLGGKGLCNEEKTYIKNRRQKVNTTLSKQYKISTTPGNEPIIAICGSGGGVRATVAFNGSKNGLAKIGLLDAVTYESTLSGSTWECGPSTHFNFSPSQYKEFLKKRLPDGLITKRFSIKQLGENLFKKFIFDKPLSITDIYGGALTSLFLNTENNKEPYEIVLSTQANTIAHGSRPFPIYNAITAYQPYTWVYFTPYEIGSNALGGFIPTWALGRKFINSLSINHAPQESLGFLLGTFGYAIGANLKEALAKIEAEIKPEFLVNILKKIGHETIIGRQRLFPAEINNFTYGMLNLPYGSKKTIVLLDAGIHYNLPMPPLLEKERAVDLILIFDNSAGTLGNELRATEAYFKEKNIPFPPIDYEKINNVVTVFKDPNSIAPTIIYFPLVKNNRYSKDFDPKNCPGDACNTFNFTYNTMVIDLLSGLAEFAVMDNKNIILDAIKDIVRKKNSQAVHYHANKLKL